MPVAVESKKKPRAPRYTRERLVRDARALGYTPAQVTGALAGETKDKFSHAELRKLIGSFRNRKVEMS